VCSRAGTVARGARRVPVPSSRSPMLAQARHHRTCGTRAALRGQCCFWASVGVTCSPWAGLDFFTSSPFWIFVPSGTKASASSRRAFGQTGVGGRAPSYRAAGRRCGGPRERAALPQEGDEGAPGCTAGAIRYIFRAILRGPVQFRLQRTPAARPSQPIRVLRVVRVPATSPSWNRNGVANEEGMWGVCDVLRGCR